MANYPGLPHHLWPILDRLLAPVPQKAKPAPKPKVTSPKGQK